jgi:hypothetical protein
MNHTATTIFPSLNMILIHFIFYNRFDSNFSFSDIANALYLILSISCSYQVVVDKANNIAQEEERLVQEFLITTW